MPISALVLNIVPINLLHRYTIDNLDFLKRRVTCTHDCLTEVTPTMLYMPHRCIITSAVCYISEGFLKDILYDSYQSDENSRVPLHRTDTYEAVQLMEN